MVNTMRTLVTGGAGFIGSNLVDRLILLDQEIIIYDNLSTGSLINLDSAMDSGNATFIDGDILDSRKLLKAMEGVSRVFHIAANADVRGGINNTGIDVKQNTLGTCSVLECMRTVGASEIIFTSSATVYGDPNIFPTSEIYSPIQTSLYGASKLAAEGIIQAYCEYFGIRGYIFRLVSWLGERYSHGVVFDLVNKLIRNPKELEILGDGNQVKSYLHVDDGIDGIFQVINHTVKHNSSSKKLTEIINKKQIYNLGHLDYINVKDLALIIADEMGLSDVNYRFLGSPKGWPGDSPRVYLDTTKIRDLGFYPKISIEDAIRRTVKYLFDNPWVLKRK